MSDGSGSDLGMRWVRRSRDDSNVTVLPTPAARHVEPTQSLWQSRWPAIALQECIDAVEAAPPEQQAQVKFDLPCQTCPMAGQCLNAKRKEIGSLMYDREILTSPRTSESSLFPEELINPLKNPSVSLVPHYRKPFSVEHEYVVVQAWDIAWSEKTGGDWLVCETAVMHLLSGQRRMLDIMRWQRKSFQEQINLIEQRAAMYSADLVVIESDAAQQIWSQQIRQNTDVPVLPHAASEGKHSLAHGVPSLLIKLENRKWEFPTGPGHNADQMQVFFDELEAFGWVDGQLQGVGEHDDTVMSFWHLNWGLDKLAREGSHERYVGMQPGRSM